MGWELARERTQPPPIWASLVAQPVKNLPTMQETHVRFLGWEDTLEKDMATRFIILAWRLASILSTDRGAWWTIVHGIAESGRTERLTLSLSFHLMSYYYL